MAGIGAVTTATGRVRQVCHCPGPGQVYEQVWIWNTQVEGLSGDSGHYFRSNAVYCDAAWNGFGFGLFVLFPNALPGGNDGFGAVYWCGNGRLFCGGHTLCRCDVAGYAYVDGQVSRVAAHSCVYSCDGVALLQEQARCIAHYGTLFGRDSGVYSFLGLCHSIRCRDSSTHSFGLAYRLSALAGHGYAYSQLLLGGIVQFRVGGVFQLGRLCAQ